MRNNKIHLIAAAALALSVAGGAPAAYSAPGRGQEQRAPKPKNVVVSGVVTAVSGNTLTIHQKGSGRNGRSVAVTVTDATRYLAADGSTINLSNIQVGAKVQAKGAQAADRVITATRVIRVKAAPTTTPTS